MDPVLRWKCQWCGSRKHAVQYSGHKVERPSEHTVVVHPDHPGVCLVCPRCDSPGTAE